MTDEKHILSRDLRPTPAPRVFTPRPPTFKGNAETIERKDTYLLVLAELGADIASALEQTEVPYRTLSKWRRADRLFRARETQVVGMDAKTWHQRMYLAALKYHCSNASKARHDAGIGKETVDAWGNDPEYKKQENEVMESFLDDAREQVVRVSTGKKTTVRDFQTLRWALAKWDKNYADKPTVNVSVHVDGMSRAEIERELALLENGDS